MKNINRVFGYARVSSKEQNEARQLKAIKDYCMANNLTLEDRDIYIDKASGKNLDREQYQLLKKTLRAGDTLIVKEMDRLSRSKADIKNEIEFFKNNGITLRILNIPTTLINFSDYGSDLAKSMMEMVNNVLIEVLSTIAEEERKKIKERQKEGIEMAKLNGKQLGRPAITYPENFTEVYNSWKAKKITGVKAMNKLGLKKTTFYKLIKEYETNKEEEVL